MIDFTCAVCGNDLEVLVCTDGSGFNVTPCPTCIGNAEDRGEAIGYEKGQDDYRERDEYI